jgi:hypothetical protein
MIYQFVDPGIENYTVTGTIELTDATSIPDVLTGVEFANALSLSNWNLTINSLIFTDIEYSSDAIISVESGGITVTAGSLSFTGTGSIPIPGRTYFYTLSSTSPNYSLYHTNQPQEMAQHLPQFWGKRAKPTPR